MSDLNRAIADLAQNLGLAFSTFAEAVRPEPASTAEPSATDLSALGLGKRQQEIAEIPGLNTDNGMRGSEIAAEISYDAANTHTALKALKDRGVVEEFRPPSGEGPRWRLAPAFRGMSDPYVRIAGLVRSGEWTTYGDISIAARDNTSAARAVGRAAATLPHFPTPHRACGTEAASRRTGRAGLAPRRTPTAPPAARRGLTFDDKGRASRAHYVSWDVLKERSEREG